MTGACLVSTRCGAFEYRRRSIPDTPDEAAVFTRDAVRAPIPLNDPPTHVSEEDHVIEPRPGRALGVPLALAVALTGAACSGGKHDDPTGPASPSITASPTPSIDASTANAQQQAIAAYQGYITTWALASQQADPDNPDLARYVADPLLSLTQHNLQKLKNSGEQQVGAQKATVLSSQVNLTATQPAVTIHACLDYSDLKLVYAKNRSPVPNSTIKKKKLSTIATVWLYKNGQWLVNKIDDGKDQC